MLHDRPHHLAQRSITYRRPYALGDFFLGLYETYVRNVRDKPMSDAAEIAMFGSGWFARSPAFWRWVKTSEAKPYVAAFTDMHRRPAAEEPYDLLGNESTPDLLDPKHLEKLARDIEARFAGDGD